MLLAHQDAADLIEKLSTIAEFNRLKRLYYDKAIDKFQKAQPKKRNPSGQQAQPKKRKAPGQQAQPNPTFETGEIVYVTHRCVGVVTEDNGDTVSVEYPEGNGGVQQNNAIAYCKTDVENMVEADSHLYMSRRCSA